MRDKIPEAKVNGYVFLSYFYTPYEAEIVEGLLKSNGINCYSEHEAVSQIFGITMNGVGRIKLFVEEKKLELAKKILEESKKD